MGALSSKSKLEWEVDIPPDLATGDLILFTTQNFGASCIRCWTQHHYDHVAMVVALPDGVRTIEAVTDGVGCWKLPERITEGVFGTVAVRRLMVDLTDDMIRNLNTFLQEAKHKKYRQPVHRWAKMICCGKDPVDPANLRGRRGIPNEPGYFCSSFVAACYMAMGLLPKEPSCEYYFPCDFAQNSKFLEPLLKKNAFLSEEIEIRYLRRFPVPPSLKDKPSAPEKSVDESSVRVEMHSRKDSKSAELQPPSFNPDVILEQDEKKEEVHLEAPVASYAQPLHVSSFFSISPSSSPQHAAETTLNASSLANALPQPKPTVLDTSSTTTTVPAITVDTSAQMLSGHVFVSVLMTPDSKDPDAVETAQIDLGLPTQEATVQTAASPRNHTDVVTVSFSPSASPTHPKDEQPTELTSSRSLPQIFFPLAPKSPLPPMRSQTPHHAWLSFPRGVPPSASAFEVRRFQRPNVPVVVPERFQRISKDQSQFRISEAMQKRQAITSSKTHDTIVWRGHADIKLSSPSSVGHARTIGPTAQALA